ncbi:helix-turn-helix domain-containing protein [Jatrophihabitans sp. GAS493]|uniref:helix-turn-helix domain-containing protein n=1 Tax=Jatrophihabitans sp. GAS493 TaxID=1907575 RepID=UPI000BB929F6|nr:helix-turn-helix domain-containing protein [Jatrophihabitans sp. GAS493]
MGRKAIHSAEEKLSVVLAVLKGEMTQVEIARRLEISQTTVSKWLKIFTQSGLEGLARGENPRAPASRREGELQAQIEDLTTALGEAYVELRVWRKGGALYPPSRTSR